MVKGHEHGSFDLEDNRASYGIGVKDGSAARSPRHKKTGGYVQLSARKHERRTYDRRFKKALSMAG